MKHLLLQSFAPSISLVQKIMSVDFCRGVWILISELTTCSEMAKCSSKYSLYMPDGVSTDLCQPLHRNLGEVEFTILTIP